MQLKRLGAVLRYRYLGLGGRSDVPREGRKLLPTYQITEDAELKVTKLMP